MARRPTKVGAERFPGSWDQLRIVSGREIANIHRDVGLNDYHFDAFLADLQKALMGAGADEQLIDEV